MVGHGDRGSRVGSYSFVSAFAKMTIAHRHGQPVSNTPSLMTPQLLLVPCSHALWKCASMMLITIPFSVCNITGPAHLPGGVLPRGGPCGGPQPRLRAQAHARILALHRRDAGAIASEKFMLSFWIA